LDVRTNKDGNIILIYTLSRILVYFLDRDIKHELKG